MNISLNKTGPTLPGLPFAFYGTLVHSLGQSPTTTDPVKVEYLHNSLLIVSKDGIIEYLEKNIPLDSINEHISHAGYSTDVLPVKKLPRGSFLMPGLIDTHHHAPQWGQRGLGQGVDLLEWLDKITFRHEAKFADTAYAKQMYRACIRAGIRQGVTTAAYYGSKHGEATKILAEICLEEGQRALVGKCNMNREAPEWYRDASVEESVQETKELIAHVRALDKEERLVAPILTPRFAISCTDDLLSRLGDLARQDPTLRVQTHFNEATGEMLRTKELYPAFRHEAELYEHFGLLRQRTILAHAIFLDEQGEELDRIAAVGCGIAHCPIATSTMGEFMAAPIRQYLERGVPVGLGTDSGGGFSSSILDAMRQSLIISKYRETKSKGVEPALTLAEAFHLATLGGARVCGLDDRVGNFVVGKTFDALEIYTLQDIDKTKSAECSEWDSIGVMSPILPDDSIETIFEKFLMTGDDRNIAKVYIQGRAVKF